AAQWHRQAEVKAAALEAATAEAAQLRDRLEAIEQRDGREASRVEVLLRAELTEYYATEERLRAKIEELSRSVGFRLERRARHILSRLANLAKGGGKR
ncbi:MAG: hypothetical protein LBO20_05035, partial [Bifidobacteriaceae bacterium]|nr:hypothetical protein [Bifidobacteriaceae bacterium]